MNNKEVRKFLQMCGPLLDIEEAAYGEEGRQKLVRTIKQEAKRNPKRMKAVMLAVSILGNSATAQDVKANPHIEELLRENGLNL